MIRNKSFSSYPFYFIATPIGNLLEMTPRALEILKEVDFVCVEDTRTSGLLLHHFDLKKEMISVHKFNETKKVDNIIERLKAGKKGAFLSDAGYPLISDPGAILVQELLNNNLPLSVVNGPSAFLPALLGSGLQTNTFTFLGFLTGTNEDVKQKLLKIKKHRETLLFYTAPHDLLTSIKALFAVLNDRKLVIARELSKLHEEYIYTTLADFLKEPLTLKGEIVLVVEGAREEVDDTTFDDYLDRVVLLIKEKKYRLKEAVSIVSLLFNVSKNKLYDAYLAKYKED